MVEPTEKQKAFCEHYLRTNNGAEAYLLAFGEDSAKDRRFASNAAGRLLRKPHVKAYYDSLTEKPRSERIAAADEVLEYFTRVMRGEEKDQVGLDTSISDRNRAAEALGKRYGLFTEKLDVKGSLDIASALKKAPERALGRADDS